MPGKDGTGDTFNRKITPGKEDYLNVMLELSGKRDIRSIDVDALGVTKARVSCMMNKLKEEGYITKEKYGTIALKTRGFEVAANVRRRYGLLKAFFITVLGVDATTAFDDVCGIEHVIGTESFSKINEHLKCP